LLPPISPLEKHTTEELPPGPHLAALGRQLLEEAGRAATPGPPGRDGKDSAAGDGGGRGGRDPGGRNEADDCLEVVDLVWETGERNIKK